MRRGAFLMAASVAALALSGTAAAQDLATAIADARAHSPALAAADADAEAADARLAQARAAAGPTARVEGSVGTGRLDPGGYFGLAAQSVTPSAVQLVGEYPLYAGGRISAAIDQAAAGSRAATLGKDMARQNLTLATVGAYAEVLTARDLVASYGKLVDALSEIVRHGRVRRAYLGIGAGTIVLPRRIALRLGLPQKTGAVISSVEPKSPADEAGLLSGDIVLAVGGEAVAGVDDLVRLLDAGKIDKTVPIDILRRSDQRRFWAALRER